jgi:hypothetical protein
MPGIIAHAQPPIRPAITMPGKISGLSDGQKASPKAAPQIAPMMYCPSAPIFQIPALNPRLRPIAIRMSGPALIRSCGRENPANCSLKSGSQKMMRIAATGSLPRTANMMPPAIMVRITAMIGVAAPQKRDGMGRFSSTIIARPQRRRRACRARRPA